MTDNLPLKVPDFLMSSHEYREERKNGCEKLEASLVKDIPALQNISSSILSRNRIGAEAHINI